MPDQRSRSLTILALAETAISGSIAVVIFALYGLRPSSLNDTGASLTAAILGVAAAVYFATIHQTILRRRQALSTFILTVITAVNFVLVIASTGGLDSPYYSLWLLAIVVAGIFGTTETLVVLSLTTGYYLYSFIANGLDAGGTRDHLIQLGISLLAGALAEWVHSRSRGTGDTAQLSDISGSLNADQLKADAIVASIGEGVMVIDASRRIQLFNKAAQQLTGWDEGSAQNIDYNLVLQLKTSDDKPLNDTTDPFAEAWKKSDTVVRDNVTMTSRSGRKTQINLSISPLFTAKHEPGGAIALFRDISREKEIERQKDEFISTASHEMRTPVAAIEGYIALAMNPNVATIDDRAKKYLDKAHDTIGHLGQLFRDLLSVTKAEEGMLKSKIELVNVTDLLKSATDDMQFTAAKKKLTLVLQVGDSTGKAIAPLYYVAANSERLREVVMNLIDNAMKYTPEGGIKVTLGGTDKEVTVGVSDSGIGIAPEDISHLFQKFYRIDNSATRTIGGTGLGLYLCRKVIELFNGRIWVESNTGKGSTFSFTLPRLTQIEVERMQAAAATAATAPATQSAQAATPGPEEASNDNAAAPAPRPAAMPTPVPQPLPEDRPQSPPPTPLQPKPGAGPALPPIGTPHASPANTLTTTPQRRMIR